MEDNFELQKRLAAKKKLKSLYIISILQFLFIILNIVLIIVGQLGILAFVFAVVYIFLLVNMMKGCHFLKEDGAEGSKYINVVKIVSPIIYFITLLITFFACF